MSTQHGDMNVCHANLGTSKLIGRAKFKRKISLNLIIPIFVLQLFLCLNEASSHSLTPSTFGPSSCGDVFCLHGTCVDGRCVCDRGWQGSACHRCGGRIRLDSPSGFISDGFTNYSTDLQCTWLIDSGSRDNIIRMQLIEFETECSWDHLYIFDGDSLFSPLIAAYSGLLVKNGHYYQEIPEIVAQSGKAFLYFYSDAAYNMSGFNVSYSFNGCPKNCSTHGFCSGGSCICDGGWDGEACDVETCPSGCSLRGVCDPETRKCTCNEGFFGPDCSQSSNEGVFQLIPAPPEIHGRALHAATVQHSYMWVTGGEYFRHSTLQDPYFLVRFDFRTEKWDRVRTRGGRDHPEFRYGHSLTAFEEKLFMYGGVFANGTVTRDLWAFDTDIDSWSLVTDSRLLTEPKMCLGEICSVPLATAGHTATLVKDRIYFIFGHNPTYGYLNTVQVYSLSQREWVVLETKGAIVKGTFGHSAAYDEISRLIFVHGGYHSYGTDSVLTDSLYAFDPLHISWRLLNPSQAPRYLHAAVVLNGLLFVYGGNGHNATHDYTGDKCFSPHVLVYDIECDSWSNLKDPSTSLKRNLESGRYGHTAVSYEQSFYAFGGFNGIMLNSIMKYTPGQCSQFKSKMDCSRAKTGALCVWNSDSKSCVANKSSSSSFRSFPFKDRCTGFRFSNFSDLCDKQSSCPSCLESTYGCVWCSDSCSMDKCKKPGLKGLTESQRCSEMEDPSSCDKLHNCHACHTESHCVWQRDHKCYTVVKEMGNRTQKATIQPGQKPMCDAPCHTRTTCSNCSSGPSCMWCASLQRCIESNAYSAIFPMAQCMEWTIHQHKCTNCSEIQTCDKCQLNPRCGWCDDGSGTGVGKCMEGADEGPYSWSEGNGLSLKRDMCLKKNWYFTACPTCQCNGHSLCLPGTSECRQPCNNLTEGSHCQYCQASYHGNPINGGTCKPCSCNNHSYLCNRETGKCHCTTKGIVGDSCDRCDEQNHYFGNPTEKGGSCFYNLTIDFQYTFNMSKIDDKYLNRINFMNVPMKSDVDVDFTISCSRTALVNISIGSNSLPVRTLYDILECGTFKLRFSHDEHLFGMENTTFYVNVFRFETPFVLQISFSQHRTLDLLQFFVTFSSCFLTLLIIAAILWKIKQKYDMYRRRQQLFLELQNMASRPFAGITLEVEKEIEAKPGEPFLPSKNNNPTPVALEPCSTGKAAVLSLIVRLPTGGTGVVPPGQTGLAIASALVSLGTLDSRLVRDSQSESNNACKQVSVNTKCVGPETTPTVL